MLKEFLWYDSVEGFCDHKYPGHYADPNDYTCFIVCNKFGHGFSQRCAPGTKWKQGDYPDAPSGYNRCSWPTTIDRDTGTRKHHLYAVTRYTAVPAYRGISWRYLQLKLSTLWAFCQAVRLRFQLRQFDLSGVALYHSSRKRMKQSKKRKKSRFWILKT